MDFRGTPADGVLEYFVYEANYWGINVQVNGLMYFAFVDLFGQFAALLALI